MKLVFYTIKDPNNKIDKTLSNAVTINGNLLENCNIITPHIKIQATNPSSWNYCYIEDFNRYYYIQSMDCVQKDIWDIKMSIDVLKTYAKHIKSSKVVAVRSESDNELMYNDGTLKTRDDIEIYAKNFNTFGGGEPVIYLLTCI